MLRTLGIAGLLLLAQTQAPPPPLAADEHITLHAYSNLVQIPVLVLSNKRMRLSPLTPDQFIMNIDGGPYFHPRAVRQEGSDAIRIVILLDAEASMTDLLSSFDPALQDLSDSLTDKDVVSISCLHGSSFLQTRGAAFTPAWRNDLSAFVQQQLAADISAPADDSLQRLLSAVAMTLPHFGTTTSRRVLLLVTNSKAGGGGFPVRQLITKANSFGITIFALRQQPEGEARRDSYVLSRDAFPYAKPQSEGADALATLTEGTGGVTLEIRDRPLAEGMMRVIRLVRERYILDFAPPFKAGVGVHSMNVRTKKSDLFVRAGGIGIPMPDPAIAHDPNTVPSDPTSEPPIGTRKVLPR